MRVLPIFVFNTRFKSLILLLVVILICLYNPSIAWSSEVSKVKGNQVLIVDFDGKVGEQFYAIDGNGKRKAIIEIKKAKGGRAIGEITKGKADVGFTLTIRTGGGGKRAGRGRPSPIAVGALFGYSMNSMMVPVRTTIESLTGSGFSVKGAGDYNFSESIGLRLTGGYESFAVKNATYTTTISYVTFDAFGRYLIMPESPFSVWLGAGLGFAIPFSKSTNILQDDSIATSTLLYLGGGVDLKLGENFYFPIQADYAMFLPASDVKTSIIAIRGGVMMRF